MNILCHVTKNQNHIHSTVHVQVIIEGSVFAEVFNIRY